MDPNALVNIERFVQGMEKVDDIIKEENPDIIIAPMMGANPFIDVLNILNEDFPNHKVEYVPASSRLEDPKKVMRNAFYQIIKEHQEKKYLSIDEVVSGNSAERVHKQFKAALMQYANEETLRLFGETTDFTKENVRNYRDTIIKEHEYKTIGIEDERILKRKKERNPEYKELLKKGIAIPVPVGTIPTMDRPSLMPWKYEATKNKKFLPKVSKIEYNQEYIAFLKVVAGIAGKNPNEVEIKNIAKIMNAYKTES